MIDHESLIEDLKLLASRFYKVIEVNLDEDTYFEVKVDDEDRVIFKGMKTWVDEFAKFGVYPDDKENFIRFFDPFLLKSGAKEKRWQRVYYRRKIGTYWRFVCMEVVPTKHFSDDEPIVLIVVRDVDDYIRDYHDQFGYIVPGAANV